MTAPLKLKCLVVTLDKKLTNNCCDDQHLPIYAIRLDCLQPSAAWTGFSGCINSIISGLGYRIEQGGMFLGLDYSTLLLVRISQIQPSVDVENEAWGRFQCCLINECLQTVTYFWFKPLLTTNNTNHANHAVSPFNMLWEVIVVRHQQFNWHLKSVWGFISFIVMWILLK